MAKKVKPKTSINKKETKAKPPLPSRGQIRYFVTNDLFNADEWMEFFNMAEGWETGYEVIRRFKRRFKIQRTTLSVKLEGHAVKRISEETRDVENLDYFKSKINTNLCFMINSLRF